MKNQPFYRRFGFAARGIKHAWQNEASFRFQCAAAPGVLSVLIVLRATPLWWAIILLTAGLVLALELMNTAFEHLIDRLHPEVHPTIKTAKDCAAGSVLMASIVSVGVFVAFLIDTLL